MTESLPGRGAWRLARRLALGAALWLAAPLGAPLAAQQTVQPAAPSRAPAVPRPVGPGDGAARAGGDAADDSVNDASNAPGASRLTDALIQSVPPPVTAATASGLRVAEDEPGSELTVYLMTIGVGDAVWQRFGHNALWIHDGRSGTDVAYNWGMFDFEQPNFLSRFLTGETRYWMEGFDAYALAGHYAQRENRSVWVQELALSPAQRLALRDYVKWNEREENRYYRYDYYRDNCSTRVRDAIDRVLGGAIQRQLANRPTGQTFRTHTRRLTAGDAIVYTGTQIALGRPVDVPLSAWEEGFLPTRLMTHLRDVRVPGPDGRPVPLVRAERTMFAADRAPESLAVPSYWYWYGAVGFALLAAFALLAHAARRARGAAITVAVLAVAWTFLFGVVGTVVVLGMTLTRHAAYMSPNANVLFVSPLVLVLCALVAGAVWLRSPVTRARVARVAEVVALAVAALAVVGAVLQVLPRVGQGSAELAWLFVPAHVGVWIAVRYLRGIDVRRAAAPAAPAAQAA